MLQLGNPNSCPVAYQMADFQLVSRMRHGKERVVKQKNRKDEHNPSVLS
jgi:hypothetical protein